MCGIAGLFLPDLPTPERSAALEAIHRMNRAQHFRGPDDESVWQGSEAALGCVRLRIVGSEAAGAQPIEDPWGGRMVYNGEVYNHRRVLDELGLSFGAERSDGDALAGVLGLRGPCGLNSVRGMFAAARYLPESRRMLLVRDAVGKKPLYLRPTPGGWAFASTLAALHAGSGPLELRDDALYEYLLYRSVGGYQAAFEGVRQLPPGAWVELGPGGYVREGRWWQAPSPGLDALAPSFVRQVLDESVVLRSDPSREVGVFLSGGLDSTIVAHSLREQVPEQAIRWYFVGYDSGGFEDERGYAKRVAERLGGPSCELQLDVGQVPELLSEAARLTENPIQDPVVVPTILLARAASERTKVVLTGDGSDEIWGGYERFDRAPDALDAYLLRTMIFRPDELELARPPASYLHELELPDPELAPLDRFMRLELANRLRNYHMGRLDKVSMGSGLEARCPFLDVRVVELGMRTAARIKRPDERPKGLLADAYRDLLPDWLIERRKQPFSVPIRAWLSGGLRDFAHDLLLDPGALAARFVDPRPLLTDLDQSTPAAEARARRAWSLLQLEVWHRDLARPLGEQP